jgi:hypothetical protein
MSLSHREKVLARVVAVLGVVVVGWLVLGVVGGPLDSRRAERDRLDAEIKKRADTVTAAKKAQDRLADWNRQSLPSDASKAALLYQNWLQELVGKVGFHDKKVMPTVSTTPGDWGQRLPYTVQGQATLEQLVQFLFDFYRAGHLHIIRHLEVKPVPQSKEFTVRVTIDALSLSTADRKDKLTDKPSDRLALKSADEYRKLIGTRNMMAAYRPKPPPSSGPSDLEKQSSVFDPSKWAFVTGIVSVGGKPMVWIKSRTTDKSYQLQQGDKFDLGPFHATIARINPRDVEIVSDGKRVTIALGGNVRGDVEPKKPSEPSEAKGEGGPPKSESMKPKTEGGEPEPKGRGSKRDRFRPRPGDGGPMPPGGPSPYASGPGPDAPGPMAGPAPK